MRRIVLLAVAAVGFLANAGCFMPPCKASAFTISGLPGKSSLRTWARTARRFDRVACGVGSSLTSRVSLNPAASERAWQLAQRFIKIGCTLF